MSPALRVASVSLMLVMAASGCTHGKKTATPPTSSSTTAASSAESSLSSSTTTSESATPAPSPSESSAAAASSPPPTSSESPTPSSPTSPAPDETSQQPTSKPATDPAQVTQAQKLLVEGVDVGPKWQSAEIPEGESTHEQGDLCGTATAGEKDRVLSVATDLTNDDFEGAGRHEIARYRPGRAAAVARTVLDLLAHCSHVKQDFDGSQAEVTVTPVSANVATFSLKFGPGSVNYGAIAITNTGDYVSTSASFAADAATAAELATTIDAAAKRKLASAGVK